LTSKKDKIEAQNNEIQNLKTQLSGNIGIDDLKKKLTELSDQVKQKDMELATYQKKVVMLERQVKKTEEIESKWR